jgi:segregation and condensation protein B
MDQIKQIIESLLFVSDSPLAVDHIQRAVPEADSDTVKKALLELKAEYEARNGGFLLHEVAGGFQFRTKKEFKEWIRRLFQPTLPKLSAAAMETLAIIAYRQPVLRNEIEHIRGVNSGNTLRILLERRLIRVLGRREIPGRPLVYATTRKFLETFDLKDLKDLPTPKEIEGMEVKTFPSPAPEPLEITAGEPDAPLENPPENIA